MTNWLLRMIKGIFIGAGFILPGVSGGALAAVFGLYERLIMFLADITKDFKKNCIFFLPVAIGACGGVFVFSVFLNYFFEVAYVQLTWFFIGCIVGVLPYLWVQAGENGRKITHIIVLLLSFGLAVFLLRFIGNNLGGQIELNFFTWLMAGCLIALGMIVPGLSPSNLLLFLQIYSPMTRAISELDFSAIIPIGVGGLVTVMVFSRLMAFIFEKAYGLMFHLIIGLVMASTVLIIPGEMNLLCFAALILGILLALWMCKLEERNQNSNEKNHHK